MDIKDPFLVFIDGASKGNPGPAGAGVVIYRGDKIVERISHPLGKATNNIAEYEAVILGLRKVIQMGARRVTIFSDSKLLVNQMNGEWRIKDKALMRLAFEVNRMRKGLEEVTFIHILRERNKEANLLAAQGAEVAELGDAHGSGPCKV